VDLYNLICDPAFLLVAWNPTEPAAKAAGHLRRRQNQPEAVKASFGKPEVRYAVARS
jgi:hypothetical protein